MRQPCMWLLAGIAACGGDPPPPDPALVERIGNLETRVAELEAALERERQRAAALPTVDMEVPATAEPATGPLVRIAIGRTTLAVDGRAVALEDLERELAAKKTDGALRVAIESEIEAPHGAVVRVLDVVKKVGGRVAISAQKSGG